MYSTEWLARLTKTEIAHAYIYNSSHFTSHSKKNGEGRVRKASGASLVKHKVPSTLRLG